MRPQLEINGRSLSIISEAVGGTNVDNCPHACIKKPCGPFAECIPNFESYECQCNPTNVQCNKAEELTSQQIDAMVKQHQTTTTTTPLPQYNRQFGSVLAAASMAVASSPEQPSRTIKTATIQNEFTATDNGPDDGVYKTAIQIAANERKGIASGVVVVVPTTTSYDASEAYSLNQQNDYGGGSGNNDGDDDDDDDDDDDYYDYNPDTKENVAQTDDDGK